MKRVVQITGILLMLLLAGNTSLNAQRGMRGGMDTTRMNRPGREAGFRQMNGPGHGQEYGMRGGRNQVPSNYKGIRPAGPGRNRIGNIPNLTEKQKTEIAAMNKGQQEEMKKFRDEMSIKMQALRDDHKKKLLGILTDEQKKQITPAPVLTDPNAPKSK